MAGLTLVMLTWNSGSGWDPIGGSNGLEAIFEGNGHAISNLFIDRGATDYVGLFRTVASGGVARNVGVANAHGEGRDYAGVLVGQNQGRVSASWATGDIIGDDHVGGLVGSNGGVIAASYSNAAVSGADKVGGLVGENGGSILASYATGSVSGSGDSVAWSG